MHIVPGIDDGAVNLEMALKMLETSYDQGVRNIFCTSHNGYERKDADRYKSAFSILQKAARSQNPDLKLHTGCEILCAEEYINKILLNLETGVFLPLGKSKYVLTELYRYTSPEESMHIVKKLTDSGWKPIIAHAERYPLIFYGQTVKELIRSGALFQINLFSLSEEANDGIKERARYLVKNQYAHFIGSDAHRSDHRPPRYEIGIEYLRKNCDKKYFEKLCYGHAAELII